MKRFRQIALALIVAALAMPASADVILTFGQVLRGDTIIATDDGTTTDITGTDIAVTVTEIEANSPSVPFAALLNLNATSTGPAQIGPLGVIEPFDGTFSIVSPLCGIAFNCLSGTFSGATFGFLGGASLTLSGANPPGSLVFTSDVITTLGVPRGLSFSFANVAPPVSIDGTTIAAFQSSVSGTFSATPAVIPEPASVLLFAIGLLGLALFRRRV
jgi:hypothetical protein